jgi:hypothetical protein
MRADDAAWFNGQASQMHPAVAFGDARGADSFAAISLDDLLITVELEDLHGAPFHEPGRGNCRPRGMRRTVPWVQSFPSF